MPKPATPLPRRLRWSVWVTGCNAATGIGWIVVRVNERSPTPYPGPAVSDEPVKGDLDAAQVTVYGQRKQGAARRHGLAHGFAQVG